MSYEEMLRMWRYAEIGHPMFIKEVGQYFGNKMWKEKDKLTPAQQSKISKKVDWPKDKGGIY